MHIMGDFESAARIADCFKNNPSGKEGCTGINEKGEYEYCYVGRCNILVFKKKVTCTYSG